TSEVAVKAVADLRGQVLLPPTLQAYRVTNHDSKQPIASREKDLDRRGGVLEANDLRAIERVPHPYGAVLADRGDVPAVAAPCDRIHPGFVPQSNPFTPFGNVPNTSSHILAGRGNPLHLGTDGDAEHGSVVPEFNEWLRRDMIPDARFI